MPWSPMAFLSIPARLSHRALTRSAHPLPRIPPTRSITTGRARIPPSFHPPPPARRHFEYAPLPTKPQGNDGDAPGATRRRPTNRHIPFDHVYVLDPDTNKLSLTKQSLESLLALAAPQRQIVELVASAPKPIVRVTTRSEIEGRYREMRRALRKGARLGEEPKEVQLTWGVARADLEHKLRKAGRDLEKGYRVIVAVTMKKRHRPSSRQELVAFADEISTTLAEVAEEWKEREITERLMVLSFQKTKLDEDALQDR